MYKNYLGLETGVETIKGRITEIFPSIQGEGKYIGTKQLFIRFAGCNLDCVFCDTDIEKHHEYTVSELVKKMAVWLSKESFHSVSLTGGEPLLQTVFLQQIMSEIKKLEQIIYLETNGTLPQELNEVISLVDIVSLDFKLPSAISKKVYWNEHLASLRIAKSKDSFVKIVLTPEALEEEIELVFNIIEKQAKTQTVILQPATQYLPLNDLFYRKIRKFQELGLKRLVDVRVISQMHPFLGVR